MANEYLDFLEQQESERQQAESARIAATSTLTYGVNPDTAAKARKTAGFLGVAPAVVEAAPEESERRAQAQKLDVDTAQTPTLRARYSDADFHKLASDDSGVLSGIESVVRRMMDNASLAKPEFKLAKDAAMSVGMGATAGLGAWLFDAAGLANEAIGKPLQALGQPDHYNPFLKMAKDARGQATAARGAMKELTPAGEGNIHAGVFSGLQSLGSNLALLPAGAAAQSGAALAGIMSAFVGAQAYTEARNKGLEPVGAATYAIPHAAFEYAFEKLPASRLIQDLMKGSGIWATAKRQFLPEVLGEQATTVLQDLNDWTRLNPEKTLSEFAAERPDAAAQTLVATLVGVSGQSAAVGVVNQLSGKREQAEKAEQLAANVEQLAGQMAVSKLRERAPDSFNQLIAQIAESGEAPTELYIDAEQLANTLNQGGIDIEALRAVAPSVAAQMEAQNFVPGADIRVPVAEFAAAGPEIVTPLLDHLRGSSDAMSRAEAQEYLKTEGDKIRADVETQLAERQDGDAFRAQVQQVTTQFEQEMNAAGKFRPEVNKAYATLLGNFYAVQALRANKPLAQFMQDYQLQVTAKDVKGGQRLEQSTVESRIRELWSQTQGVALGSPAPLVVEHNGKAVQFLARQDALSRGKNKSTIHLQVLRRGRMIAGMPEGWIVAGYKLDGKDNLVPEGVPRQVSDAEAAEFNAHFAPKHQAGDRVGNTLNQSALPAPARTPEFNKWFAASAAVDDAGKPRVLYHGTADSFTEFDASEAGKNVKTPASKQGFYFTDRPDLAGRYAAMREGEQQILPVFLSMQNPSRFSAANMMEADKKLAAGFEGDGAIVEVGTPDGPKSTVYVVKDATQIKSATGNNGNFDGSDPNILHQPARGALSFGADITAAPSVIALLENADPSTFIHESGHFFLEVQADLAAKIQTAISAGTQVSEAERGIVADMDRILVWFGVQGDANMTALDRWVSMTLEEKRVHHEQWARGFEKYVAEGRAPSQELQTLFAKFRAWLVQVYKSLTNLNVELTDDVRNVMDRMLASDKAIADAQAARAMGPLFQTPEKAGMTPEEFADYQALAERATATASADLDARLMRDMKWLSRARDKALKARQAEVDALRREAEREVRAEVMAEPIYRAWAFLTGKADPIAPGTVAPENMTELASGKLRSSLVKETNPDAFDRLAELRMVSEKNGLDPDIVAELFGFTSGKELIETLKITAKPAAVVAELTDFRMMQDHGDIASPEALNRAADEAVHNELRARVIASELKALANANKVKEAGSNARNTIDVMAQAARQYAQQVIARQKIKDLRPQQYAAAEARSAKLAEQSLGDTAEAAMHKRNQLVNNYATKAAYDAQKEVKKGVEFFRKVATASRDSLQKTRDWDVVQAARAILAEYGVGKKGEAAQSYLKAVADNDPAMYAVLRDKVDALTVNARPLNELTVEEFRGLHEEMQALWYLAKRSRQMEIDGNLLDIQDVTDPLVERMEAIGIPDRVPGEGQAVTDAERRVAKLQTLRAALRRVESWVGVKDGADMGPFRRFIWQPIKEAADAYRADKAKYIKRYRELLAPLDVGRERITAPELNYTFGFSRGGSGKAEILHALLHTGNASNLRKLLLGRQWATERPDGTLDTTRWDAFVTRMIAEGKITKADFDFAQGVWDLLEDMKPLAQKTHRDVFGRYFDEVTADPFTNQFGSYRGGYVPAMMDSEVVKDAATRALQEDENATLAYAFPATAKGFTKTRVENNKPLLLDLRSLSSHIDKVLLFSHMEQPIRDVRKVLTSKAVSTPLHRIDPVAFDGMLTPWMNRAARQTVETRVPGDNGMMRFFSKARSRAGMAAMFANITNTAQQITGLSIAAVKVRPALLLSATAQWVRAPRQTARAVADASPYMATRMDNEVAHMTDAINDILLNPGIYESAQAWAAKHAYFMQAAVDNVIGPIVWTGAYNQALEAGHPERDARRLADAAVRETQGSTLPEDVSRIETGNAFVRMFTQFAGYFNMQANTLGTEFAKTYHDLGLRKGMGRGLYVFTLGFLVPAMVSELIVQAFRGGPDDEDRDGSTLDDWLMAVLVMGNVRAALGMAPGAGQAANALINSFNRKPYDDRISTSPAVSMLESAVSAPHSVYKAVFEDGNARKAVRDLATLISMTTGLPASAIARPLGYLAGVAQDKIEPTGPVDAARGVVTGVASPESKR